MPMRWNRLYRGTEPELALEDAVASLGVPYRSQFPGFLFGFRFFPDFLLPTLQLVIEVDDRSHNTAEKKLEDAARTEKLHSLHGWAVVRCTNEEALSNPKGAVIRMLDSVGLWPIPDEFRKRKISDYMPKPKKCPPKEKREARSAARQRRRGVITVTE